MAWDIYGNKLYPGNCEVHPHIGEEYPCYVCRERDHHYEQVQEHEREQADQLHRGWHIAMREEYCNKHSRGYKVINTLLYFLSRVQIYLEKQKAKIEEKTPF